MSADGNSQGAVPIEEAAGTTVPRVLSTTKSYDAGPLSEAGRQELLSEQRRKERASAREVAVRTPAPWPSGTGQVTPERKARQRSVRFGENTILESGSPGPYAYDGSRSVKVNAEKKEINVDSALWLTPGQEVRSALPKDPESPFIINPRGPLWLWVIYWGKVVGTLSVWNALCVPAVIAYDMDTPLGMRIFNGLVDVVFLLDIALNFNLGIAKQKKRRTILILDRRKVLAPSRARASLAHAHASTHPRTRAPAVPTNGGPHAQHEPPTWRARWRWST